MAFLSARTARGDNDLVPRRGRRFDLVLISEMMEESLVLLHRELGIPLEEVYAGHFKDSAGAAVSPTPRQTSMMEELMALDHKLYAHFHRLLERKWAAAEKAGAAAELERLRSQAARVDESCARRECPVALITDPSPPDGYIEHFRARDGP